MKNLIIITILTLSACAADMTDPVEVGLSTEALTVTPAANKVDANLGANVSLALQVAEVVINRWGGTPSGWSCGAATSSSVLCSKSGWTLAVRDRISCVGGGFDYNVTVNDHGFLSDIYVRLLNGTVGNTTTAWNMNSPSNTSKCRPFADGASIPGGRALMSGAGDAARLVYN